MSQDAFGNFIGGEFVASADATENQNPSDLSDIIGEFARAEGAQANGTFGAACRFLRSDAARHITGSAVAPNGGAVL